MAIELKVPTVGESITEVLISEWLKAEGDAVAEDEPIVIIETDKVNVELPAPEAGVITKITKGDGSEATVGEVIGLMEAGAAPAAKAPPADSASPTADETATPVTASHVTPAARRVLAEAGLDPNDVAPSGKGGRLLKEDVLRHIADAKASPKPPAAEPQVSATPVTAPTPVVAATPATATRGHREEEIVNMSPLRKRVAQRLVEAQHNAAILTTFNEIDMSGVMALRRQYKEPFIAKYGVKLGFMSFFVKATIEALKEVPGANAEIRGDQIVYRNYFDIGVAIGGGKGLVVPVIRNAEHLSFAEVESTIGGLAVRARDNKLTLAELQGGTFTISNGGVYGSLLSTPILNPPQSGILGLHKIEERPVAINGEVVIRPMMYVALSYDHRMIDGREAVTFLVRIKERIEDPSRILLEV